MPPSGSGPGAKPPAGIVVNHPGLQRIVRTAVPTTTPPTSIAPLPSVIHASGYADVAAPQTPAAKSGGFMGLVRRVFGGASETTTAPAFDPSPFFGFRPEELSGDPTGAIPVTANPSTLKVGAKLAFVPGEGFWSRGQYEKVSPQSSGDTAPNPVIHARSGHLGSTREGHTAVLTRALPHDLARPAAVPTSARPQPVARPVARPMATAAPTATADTAGPSIDEIVGTIRRVHTNAGLTFTARKNGAHGISVTATQPGLGGSIRISASTLAAPDEDAMAAVIAGVEPFGQRNVRPAYDIAVVFEDPQTMLELGTARGLRYVKSMEALIILEGNRGERSVAAHGTTATASAAGSLWVVGTLTARNFPVDHSQIPQILVVIPWAPTVQRSDRFYGEDVKTAMSKLREALRRVAAALPNTEADSGGGQGRRR